MIRPLPATMPSGAVLPALPSASVTTSYWPPGALRQVEHWLDNSCPRPDAGVPYLGRFTTVRGM